MTKLETGAIVPGMLDLDQQLCFCRLFRCPCAQPHLTSPCSTPTASPTRNIALMTPGGWSRPVKALGEKLLDPGTLSPLLGRLEGSLHSRPRQERRAAGPRHPHRQGPRHAARRRRHPHADRQGDRLLLEALQALTGELQALTERLETRDDAA